MVKRYKKRPTEPEFIEAIQFTEDCDVGALVGWIKSSHKCTTTTSREDGKVTEVHFFNGYVHLCALLGDYVVKDEEGTF